MSQKQSQPEKSNVAKIEEEILEFWKEDNTFQKSIDQRDEEKSFSFYDGPPFATGLPHYGHILGSCSKDLVGRYWTMKGYRTERNWGWDCHGLPIENIAEKALGLKKKSEVSEMGVKKFNDFCRSKVLEYANDWETIIPRIGRWVNFKKGYKTMDNSYVESIWWAFKKMHDNGYIYEDKKVLMFCPRCETPISNAETAMDNSYQDVTDQTVTVKFRLKDNENSYLLAWTTTPWTLIGNATIAVSKDLDYVKVKQGDSFVILAKAVWEAKSNSTEANEEMKGEVVSEFKGSELVGLEYEPLYEVPTDKKGYYVINAGDEVSAEEGTGMIHMALYGEIDYEMIKKHDLPQIQHINSSGKLVLGPKEWHGKWFKDLNKDVLEDLEKRGLAFEVKEHEHSYPFCYRCDTPLFYHAVGSWFINIQKAKSRMLELNQKIGWHPSHLKDGRFLNILKDAPDWTISRNRYWASSIPVWKCDKDCCDQIEVVGSISELQEKAIEEVEDNVDLHKHRVDEIHLQCSKCESQMTRIPEVFDCWVESGAMPFAQFHYPFEDKEVFEKSFPSDFVSEYIAQTRTWFYYMLAMSTILFDEIPFKHVVVTGTVMAEDGNKMSKSKGNFTDPMLLINQYGVDAVRHYMFTSPLMQAESINFRDDLVLEAMRKVVMLSYNVLNFYKLFAEDKKELEKSSTNILDQWILARTHQFLKEVTAYYDQYELTKGSRLFAPFIDDLSTWYVRRSRDRFKSENEEDKQFALHTLHSVLEILAKTMAPLMPFTAEQIYRGLGNTASVHLEDWPEVNEELLSENILSQMELAREIVEKAHSLRAEGKIKVRQPLSTCVVLKKDLSQELSTIIAEELNVKSVEVVEEMPTEEKWIQSKEGISLALDTELTPELKAEGMLRDLVRNMNGLRKKAGLSVGDVVAMKYQTESEDVKTVIEENKETLMKQTLASSIEFAESLEESKHFNIEGQRVNVSL